MGMMHMLKIVKTYSKFYLIKVSQRWESLRIIFHEFSKEFMYKA
jgi:hypothetical protein